MAKSNSNSLTLKSCLFVNNVSRMGYGGGIYTEVNRNAFNTMIITGNAAASGFGGGVFTTTGSTSLLNDISATGNTASYGGAICADRNTVNTFNFVSINNNSACNRGGNALTNVLITMNMAGGNGWGHLFSHFFEEYI